MAASLSRAWAAKRVIHSSSRSSKTHMPVLKIDTINQAIVRAEYAVRGELAIKAESLREELKKDPEAKDRLGFDQVISANIGNPQQLGQKGLTYLRQVIALTEYPDLLENKDTLKLFPADAINRAKAIIDEIGSTGAYTHSKGIPSIRQHVAEFIEARDGYKADPERIYLTAGASQGVSNIMQVIISSPQTGVLIPIPQYPLYTATLSLLSAQACPYYLKEKEGWSSSIEEIKQSLHGARDQGTDVRAIVVINPGNPTGACLDVEHMQEIIKLAKEESLVLLADEVYQTNIFLPERPFKSFRKVLYDMGEPYASTVELVSFHSTSKGQIGECGRRGGYFEMINFDEKVEDQIYKLASAQLCAPVSGQIGLDIMVKPPQEGDESKELYFKEIEGTQEELRRRSNILLEAFTKLEGVECTDAQGAMYLFPTITLPQKAVAKAKEQGKAADAFYCLELLSRTGICVVPGSGFGQAEGTLHFRTTFLAPR